MRLKKFSLVGIIAGLIGFLALFGCAPTITPTDTQPEISVEPLLVAPMDISSPTVVVVKESTFTPTPQPTEKISTNLTTATAVATDTPLVISTLAPELPERLPAPGIWISENNRPGSNAWIQFEVYYVDEKGFIDVLDACIDYSCDLFGDEFEAKGCTGARSPKKIGITNDKFSIDFKGILNEDLTRKSRFGLIEARVLAPEQITGTWIIPVCDYWFNFNVKRNSVTPSP